MTISVTQKLPPEYKMREAIRELKPTETMVIQSEDLAEHRSAANNAYQTRKANPRTDGYDYHITANKTKKLVTITLTKQHHG